jgi:hypothetical protein
VFLDNRFSNKYIHYVVGEFDRFGDVSELFIKFCKRAVTQTLDSQMIIEDCLFPPYTPKNFGSSQIGVSSDQFSLVEDTLESIRNNGLFLIFPRLMRDFSRIVLSLFLNSEQSAAAKEWDQDGTKFCFMMTDEGGPHPSYWKTSFNPHTKLLQVHKQWIMLGNRKNCGIVVARVEGSLTPMSILLSIEDCDQLEVSPIGSPFLNGTLQLGKISGEVEVQDWKKVTRVGPTTASIHLALLRPFFVRAITAHLEWLRQKDALLLDSESEEILGIISSLAMRVSRESTFSIGRVRRALALKLLCNQLLVNLVSDDCFLESSDERDALGFSKMEGSSYRCFYELTSKSKVKV